MNTMPEQIPQEDDTFLNLADFKWRMAGLGWGSKGSAFLPQASSGLAL